MSLDLIIKNLEGDELWGLNITHNLAKMAREAGLYEPLWHPERVSEFCMAEDYIPSVEKGLATLRKSPEELKKLNPKNGWGKYEDLVSFTYNFLKACKEFPYGFVEACR